MLTRLAAVSVLFVSLAAFACQAEETEPAMEILRATPAVAPAGSGLPQPERAPAGRAPLGDTPAASANDLFAPVLPGMGLDTHSGDCDPFEDTSEICF